MQIVTGVANVTLPRYNVTNVVTVTRYTTFFISIYLIVNPKL
jgi:hypothetical protein